MKVLKEEEMFNALDLIIETKEEEHLIFDPERLLKYCLMINNHQSILNRLLTKFNRLYYKLFKSVPSMVNRYPKIEKMLRDFYRAWADKPKMTERVRFVYMREIEKLFDLRKVVDEKKHGRDTVPKKKERHKQKGRNGIDESISYSKAKNITNIIKRFLKPAVTKFETVGSVARVHPTVSDVDIVVILRKGINLRDFIERKFRVKSGKEKAMTFSYDNTDINIWTSDKSSFGSSVLHFGAGKGIIQLKREAIKRGMKLNRYGLWKGNRKIAGEDWKEILSILKTGTKFASIKMLEDAFKNLKKLEIKKFYKQGQWPRETENYYRFRQRDPKEFIEGSFRTKKDKLGNAKIFGKTKSGDWKIQSVMIAKGKIKETDLREYVKNILQGIK
jgi:hypothetical protein